MGAARSARMAALACALLGSLPLPGAGQDLTRELRLEASVRPRTEARSAGELDVFFTSMQTRLALAAAIARDARLFVQIQDARVWGGSRYGFDPSPEALDLHQGFFEVGHRGESVLWSRVGRQIMDLANGRLIGDPEWAQTSRSYDGVRTTVRLRQGTLIDGFGVQLRESAAALEAGDATLWGIWGSQDLPAGGSVQLFWLHDRDGDDPETARSTVGVYQDGTLGPVDLTLEGAWQFGEVQGLGLEGAYLLAGALTLPFADWGGAVALGYDRYSGDASPADGTSRAFSDLFGRNHRFLGFLDLFRDIPRDTDGRGLQDFRVQLRGPLPWEGRVELAGHQFRVADTGELTSGRLADEVDLTLFWPAVMGGAFAVIGGGGWAGLGGAGEALAVAPGDVLFGYLMVQAAVF